MTVPPPVAVPPSQPSRPPLPCPACQRGRLAVPAAGGGPARCDGCGHTAEAGLVAEAIWLLGEQDRLRARLRWVQDRIAAGDVATPAPPRPVAGPPLRLQTVLLGLGAMLLVVAAVVFAAVAWDRLGATGQIGLLAVVVGSLSAAAHALRRTFRATAETLAAVAAAVAAVALIAAPRLGLGADWMRQRTSLWAALALAVVAAAAAVLARVSRLVAWRVATLVAVTGSAAAATLATVGERSAAPAPLAVAGLAGVAAALLATAPAVDERPDAHGPDDQRTDAGAPRPVGPDAGAWSQPRAVGRSLGVLAVAFALTGYGSSHHDHTWTLVWVAIAAAALAEATRSGTAATAALAGIATGHVPVFAVAGFRLSPQHLHDGQLAAALVALAVLAGAAVGAGYAADAGRRVARVAARPALTALGVTVWVLAPVRLDDLGWITPGRASGYLAVIAVLLLAVALVLRVTIAAWAAGVVGSLATVLLGTDRGWGHAPESFTLPVAGLLLLAGLVAAWRTRDGSRDSLVALGPALATALWPSALASVGDAAAGHGPWRGVAVLVAGTALVVAGVSARLRGPLAVGVGGVLAAGLGQLYALAGLVPRWVVLAAAGVTLVAVGFRLEALARAGRQALGCGRTFR